MIVDGMKECSIIGGSIFKEIKSDDRVTPDLTYCLYCKVINPINEYGKIYNTDIDYRIPLDCINGNSIKQCPACKRIYILKDPTE